MSNNSTICNPEDIVTREAKGLRKDASFGDVQKVRLEYILTNNGMLDKDKYKIPKNLVERFEDDIIYFGFTREEAKQYKVQGSNLI